MSTVSKTEFYEIIISSYRRRIFSWNNRHMKSGWKNGRRSFRIATPVVLQKKNGVCKIILMKKHLQNVRCHHQMFRQHLWNFHLQSFCWSSHEWACCHYPPDWRDYDWDHRDSFVCIYPAADQGGVICWMMLPDLKRFILWPKTFQDICPWFTAYDKYFKGAVFTQLLKYNKVLFLLGK